MATDPDVMARLAAYQAAEIAILSGAQSYNVGSMNFVLGDLAKVSAMVDRLRAEVLRSKYGGSSNRARFGDRG